MWLLLLITFFVLQGPQCCSGNNSNVVGYSDQLNRKNILHSDNLKNFEILTYVVKNGS